MNWTLQEIIDAVSASYSGTLKDTDIPAVFTDSRKVIQSGLFVPLVGEKFDGHDFAAQVLQNGAAFTLWSRPDLPEGVDESRVLRVPCTLRAYQLLGKANVKRLKIPVIAVTGSVGKTTTKDLICALLSCKYKVHSTPLNHNNEVGVPNTLTELSPEHDLAVIELGMRGLGQIASLVSLLDPAVGVITVIGESHLELLGTRENICRAKAELLDGLAPEGLAVLPGDSPFFESLKSHVPESGRCTTFGMPKDDKSLHSSCDFTADVKGLEMRSVGGSLKSGQHISVNYPGGNCELFLPMLGSHNVGNLLAALAAVFEFGVSPNMVAEVLANFKATGSRVEIEKLANGPVVIDDSYNAAPSSVKGALEVLELTAKSLAPQNSAPLRKVAVLGDMLELGPNSEQFHKDTAQMCRDAQVDLLIAVGPLSENTAIEAAVLDIPHVFWLDTREEAWESLEELIEPTDVILVKASRSIGLDYVASQIRKKYGQS